MNRLHWMVLTVALGAAMLGCQHRTSWGQGAQRPGWKLVWADEFDKAGLPDKSKWIYEEGFVRNEEAQYYTRERKENARVENGMLVIEARKERMKNPGYKAGSKRWQQSREFAEYTSAAIETRGIASWQYGRFEIRAKLPSGKGMWPAFWTLGVERGWPANGEIDIMEWWGKKPLEMTACLHYQVNGKHASKPGRMQTADPSEAFHVYAMEWTPERIEFFMDGKKFHSFDVEQAKNGEFNPYRQPHFILLNLALGGRSGGKIDDSKLPQKFIVDYVRVYQKEQQK